MPVSVRERPAHNVPRCSRRAGLSQEELGQRAGLHRTEISLLERGQRVPRLDTAIRLAAAMEVELGELAAGIDWVPDTRELGGEFLVSIT